MIEEEEIIRNLEEVGEDEVRKRCASGVYGAEIRPIVKEWLEKKEWERDRQKITETLSIARSAKLAAWIAAIAAFISALVAIVALLFDQ